MENAETLKLDSKSPGEARPPRGILRRVLRSIAAVLAGMLATIIFSLGTDVVLHELGVFPPWLQPVSSALLLLAAAYRAVFGVAGAYIAAGLAPDRPMQHALVLGAMGFVFSIVGAVATWNAGPEFGPKWYPISLIVISIPCAWAGGKLRCIQTKARGDRKEVEKQSQTPRTIKGEQR